MKKFEYRLIDTKSGFFSGIDFQELNSRLNELGQQGWEVIAVVNTTIADAHADLLITLKRELP